MKEGKRAISAGIAALIIIALIVIVGFAVYFSSTFNARGTSIVGTTVNLSTGQEYQVTFKQIAACNSFPPAFWGMPWSVTIGNITEVEPPRTPLPLNNGGPVQGTSDAAYSNITFSLPNGNYSYVVSPSFGFFSPDSGNVTVAGSNLTVPIQYTGTSCTETLTTNTISQGHPVQIVSVEGPIPPYNPGGPVIGIELKNVAGMPIVSLNASLKIESQSSAPYPFAFNVSSSNALLPNQTIEKTQTLIGGGFDSSQSYPLTISGMFENGSEFSFTQQVIIVAPSAVSTTVFAYDTMPSSFSLGNYSFAVSEQGMHAGNATTSGTTTIVKEYLGQYVTFNVTSNGTAESAMFSWSPNASINDTLPSPSQVTLFNGSINIDWFDNATGAYVAIMTT